MSQLDGIRVVVLADRLVDLGARMLAELGAEVVLAQAGDGLTHERALAWRRGLATADEALPDLLAKADILLDDRRTETDRPEVDALAAANPSLVHVVATGFPQGDPRPVTDLTLMAESGLMHVTGTREAPPLRLPGEQAYALTGIQVATAALMGLAARRRIGKGQRITVSALQSAALANYREAVMYDWTGRIGTRKGNLLVRGSSGVRQVWPCADGFVTWSMVDNPGMMRAVVRQMEVEGAAGELSGIDWDSILVAETEQATIDRWQALVASFFAAHTRAELGGWSLEQGWGLSTIVTLPEVRDSAHLKARGLFRDGLPGPLFQTHPPVVPT
ncbi:CoA transferase [Oceanicola sp. 502str15]|uniref:CoA transferase n=1 Tax=Oceanicola sp. 502str15 TaxID=2696061 RepID=UPI0020944843|nr:CoA transferase [Oceanicola sp. 502str15]MCO6381572.1 carnitine dehydratase [Oceanicola sp. 502str15]